MHWSQTDCSSSEIKLVKIVHRPTAPPDYTLAPDIYAENYGYTENNRNFEFNGKLYSSPWPEKIDLLTPIEQEDLKTAAWFHAGLSRDLSLEILLQQSPGSFLVRQSESNQKCFALSMRVPPLTPPKLAHYLVEKTLSGYKFKGYVKEFSTLKSLVIHHSVLKEHLLIPLKLPRSRVLRLHDLIVDDATMKAQNEREHDDKSPTTTLCFRKRSKEK